MYLKLKTRADFHQFVFFTMSPLWVMLLVASLAPFFDLHREFTFGPTFIEISLVALIFSFINQGHVTAAYFRGVGDAAVRKNTILKTIIGTIFFMGLTMSTSNGFIWGIVIVTFWVHYHYFRQHFGILRILSPKERLPSRWERYLDNAFCLTVYLAPILIYFPTYQFDGEKLGNLLGRSGLMSFSAPLQSLLAFFTKAAFLASPLLFAFWIFFVARLFLQSIRRKSSLDHALFSLNLFLSCWISARYLPPVLTMYSIVALHSVQYYFIVGRDFSKDQVSFKKPLFFILPIVVGLLFGVVFTFYGHDVFLNTGNSLYLVICGLGVAANLSHFYMDAYIWRRVT